MRIVAPTVVVAAAVLVGCTGGDDASPTTTTSTVAPSSTTPSVPADLITTYLGAFGDPTVATTDVAVGDAALYLDYRRTGAAILGTSLIVLPGAVSHQVCTDDGCVVLGDVVTEPETGRVVTYSVDGRPIAGRIGGAGLVADDDGVVAQTRTVYATNGGQLAVMIEIDNTTGTDVELFGFGAVLRPSGEVGGIEASSAFGTSTVAAGNTTDLLVVFDAPDADPIPVGGRISLFGLRSDGLEVRLDIEVPEPAGGNGSLG